MTILGHARAGDLAHGRLRGDGALDVGDRVAKRRVVGRARRGLDEDHLAGRLLEPGAGQGPLGRARLAVELVGGLRLDRAGGHAGEHRDDHEGQPAEDRLLAIRGAPAAGPGGQAAGGVLLRGGRHGTNVVAAGPRRRRGTMCLSGAAARTTEVRHPHRKGEGMRRQVSAASAAALAVGLTFVASVAPALARTSGSESIQGTIVASAESGNRTLLSSVFVATGAFTGTGHDVEVANRPGDPQNVTRDDLVFPRGRIHIRVTSRTPTMSANQKTCVGSVRIKQTIKVVGGTGRFRHASGRFAGALHGWGVSPRNPDGTCLQQAELLLEVDVISMRGTLSF